MEVAEREAITIKAASDVGHLRRATATFTRRVGFNDVDAGRVAIAITEAGTNLFKHAGGGEVLIRRIEDGDDKGIDFVALDCGPGIGPLATAMRDGFSTSGSSGSGLGAIARQSSVFDVYSLPNGGTALLARFWSDAKKTREAYRHAGGVSVAKPGEQICGDDWAILDAKGSTTVLVVDGLGHGQGAADAALQAKLLFRGCAGRTPEETIRRLHDGLRQTRGAAAAVAHIDRGKRVVRFAGIGNIAAVVVADGTTRSAVSQHGTLGHDVRKFLEFQYPWPIGAALVVHSDGLTGRWTLDRYPGLTQRDPTLIAAVLYRDARRGSDDTTVVVVRDAA